jgi:cytochrome c biogenesis protein CcmG, thiol:disulfide interchange protein DsbE
VNGAAPGCTIRTLGRVLGQGILSLVVTLAFPAAHGGTGFAFDAPRERLVAPVFQLPDLEENPIDLKDYQGKVVLLHFWATFCTPCLEELPALESLWRRYREHGFVIVGIAADRGSADMVRKFAGTAGVTFPVLLDPEGVVRNRYEVLALPMSYLIGRDGRFSGRILGSRDWQDPQATDAIESLLVERKP